MVTSLNQNEHFTKLDCFTKQAKKKENSENILVKLGVIAVYAASADFMLIQAARLAEQIILKSQLAEGKVNSKPHDDTWFFDNQIRSRRITSEIKKLLPFKTNTDEKKDRQINNIVKEFLSSSNDFLTSRNKILHHLLSPKGSIDEIGAYIEKTIKKFNGFRKINEEFVKILHHYRFGEKKIQYFYGNS
ncbi:MAG: hypothetical protein OES15_00700 [Nitrosopumilus sp.]|nr:hypothetical protein [Nitrosopumilus sp.]MDH3852828.1 hypothetical protein [Nitrosopumilus sp.]